MTSFELMEIAFLLGEESQRHFEYWLTISFAFIAASFFARTLFKPMVAVAFGALYMLTVALLLARYLVSGTAADRYVQLAIQQGAEPLGTSEIVIYLRLCVFLAGTSIALWFLYLNCRDRDDDT